MTGNRNCIRTLMVVLLMLCSVQTFAQKGGYTLNVTVTDKGTRESIIMATLQLQPSGAMAVTNADGMATINNVPAGEYTLQISYVGYEPLSTRVKVAHADDSHLAVVA